MQEGSGCSRQAGSEYNLKPRKHCARAMACLQRGPPGQQPQLLEVLADMDVELLLLNPGNRMHF